MRSVADTTDALGDSKGVRYESALLIKVRVFCPGRRRASLSSLQSLAISLNLEVLSIGAFSSVLAARPVLSIGASRSIDFAISAAEPVLSIGASRCIGFAVSASEPQYGRFGVGIVVGVF